MGAGDGIHFFLARGGLRQLWLVQVQRVCPYSEEPSPAATAVQHCGFSLPCGTGNALFLPKVVSVSNASSIDYNFVHRH